MPRPRQASGPLTPGQASYVLDRLIRDRRLSAGEIARYVGEMRSEIDELEERLARLRAAHGGESSGGGSSSTGSGATVRRRPGRPPGRRAAGPTKGTGAGSDAGTPKRRRGRPAKAASAGSEGSGSSEGTGSTRGRKAGGRGRKASSSITAEQLASRQLQGRYLALVRQFSENRRGQYAKLAKEKGREAAIKEMQDSLKK
jgi:hypothetical protein